MFGSHVGCWNSISKTSSGFQSHFFRDQNSRQKSFICPPRVHGALQLQSPFHVLFAQGPPAYYLFSPLICHLKILNRHTFRPGELWLKHQEMLYFVKPLEGVNPRVSRNQGCNNVGGMLKLQGPASLQAQLQLPPPAFQTL